MLGKIFAPGNRKMVSSLLAMLIGVLLDKFGGGLKPDLADFMTVILGIFAGGNVAEHITDTVKAVKAPKAPEEMTIEDTYVARRDEPMEEDYVPNQQPVDDKVKSIEQALATQANSINGIIQVLNQMRGQQQPPKQG